MRLVHVCLVLLRRGFHCVRALVLSVLLIGGVSLHAQQVAPLSRSASLSRQLQLASSAISHGDLEQAKSILQPLDVDYPQNFDVNEMLGLAYAQQKRWKDASILMRRAVAEKPRSEAAHANLGAVSLQLNDASGAMRELRIAAQLNPADGATQKMLGEAWMQLHQPKKAAVAFNRALAVNRSDSALIYDAALADFESGEMSKSAVLLSSMPGLTASASAQSLYGDVEEKLGHYQAAIEHDIQAVRLAPTEINIYVLGMEFLRHWTFDAAAREFQAGIKRYPGSERMQMALGTAYYADARYGQASAVFSGVLRQYPTDRLAARMLGYSCSTLVGGSSAGCSALIQYARQHSDEAEVNTDAAIMLLRDSAGRSQWVLAKQFLQNAIRANPRQSKAFFEMGFLLQMESMWPQSVSFLQRAIAGNPSDAEAHYRLALAYARSGQHVRAQQEIALYKKYSHQQEQNLDARLKQVKMFLIDTSCSASSCSEQK